MFMDFDEADEFAAKLFFLLESLPDDLRYKVELKYHKYKLKKESEKYEEIKKKEVPNLYV